MTASPDALPVLHAVTNDAVVAHRAFLDRAHAIAQGPEIAIHLRWRAEGRDILQLADALRKLTSDTGSMLFVNDRADVGRLVAAEGIHLPSRGMPARAARRAAPGARWIGRSVHTPRDVQAAGAEGCDYVMLGPVWPTTSHPDRDALGTDDLRHPTPVIAVGGVTPRRAAACRRAGAHGVAAISALWAAPDSAAAVRAFLLSLSG